MISAKKVRAAMQAAGGRNRLVSLRFVGISERHETMFKLFGGLPLWQQRVACHLAFAGTRFANRVLPGYTSPNDSAKYDMVFDHDLPASYVNTGTAATTGDQINALDLGMGGFESVGVDSLINGNTMVVGAFPQVVAEVSLGANIALSLLGLGPGIGVTALPSLVMHYYQSPTRGTEFANTNNLTPAFVRLRVMCV